MRALAEAIFAPLAVALSICWGWQQLFIAGPEQRRSREDPTYADALFTPILDEYDVLETRRWHPSGAEAWDCTYAIIRLPNSAWAEPPIRNDEELHWQLRFGRYGWQKTPVSIPPCDDCRDALRFCARYWPETGRALEAAVQAPGAWVSVDSIGETLDIWAPNARLAAHIRFGD